MLNEHKNSNGLFETFEICYIRHKYSNSVNCFCCTENIFLPCRVVILAPRPKENQIDLSILQAIKFLSYSSSFLSAWISRMLLTRTLGLNVGKQEEWKTICRINPHACPALISRLVKYRRPRERGGTACAHLPEYLLYLLRCYGGSNTPYDSERARVLCLSLYCLLTLCVCTCYRWRSPVYFPRHQRGK